MRALNRCVSGALALLLAAMPLPSAFAAEPSDDAATQGAQWTEGTPVVHPPLDVLAAAKARCERIKEREPGLSASFAACFPDKADGFRQDLASLNCDKLDTADARTLYAAVDRALGGDALTVDVFRAILGDEARLAGCTALADHVDYIYFGGSSAPALASAREETARTRQDEAVGRLGGRGTPLGSALSLAGALAEGAGSPDTVALAIATALGAESEQDGTQLVFTLNLGNLFLSDADKRDPALTWLRHVFLRGSLPATATEAVAPPTSEDGAETAAPSAKRMSFVLGSSAVDASDARLDVHDTCYTIARALTPQPAIHDPGRSDRQRARRAQLFEVCGRRAADRGRLAWRFGVGLVTDKNAGGDDRTRVELWGGTLVWAPSPIVTASALYQRRLLPSAVDTVGLAATVSADVGDERPGGHWANLGVTAIALLQWPEEGDLRAELRIAPELRFRVLGSAVVRVAVGPRVFTSGDRDVDLLATVGMSFDVDAMAGELLNPTLGQ